MTNPDETPDPKTVEMRLRPKPRPVLQLSRTAFIVLCSGCGIVIAAAIAAAVVWKSSKPVVAATSPVAPVSRARASAPGLDGLPKDYSMVPKLGPPLPGDLGRPILDMQKNAPVRGADASAIGGRGQSATPSQAQLARAGALQSQIFFPRTAGFMARSVSVERTESHPDTMTDFRNVSVGPVLDPAPKPKQNWDESGRTTDPLKASDARSSPLSSPYILLTGSVVPAALITAVRSDIPGQVLAQVTQDVKDSLSGEHLLIPRGSRLVGQYDTAISMGQSRLWLTWSRLILPDGRTILLDRLNAADAQGYAGLQDTTDYHWTSVVGAAAVSTLIGIGAEVGDQQGETSLVKAVRAGTADAVNRAGQQVVERQLSIRPSLSLRAGLPLRVVLSRDLILEPYGN